MNEHLGKYELITLLGSGATSEVYQALDTVLGRQVALKVLKPALVADPSAFERFSGEAQAASELFHPNIATRTRYGRIIWALFHRLAIY